MWFAIHAHIAKAAQICTSCPLINYTFTPRSHISPFFSFGFASRRVTSDATPSCNVELRKKYFVQTSHRDSLSYLIRYNLYVLRKMHVLRNADVSHAIYVLHKITRNRWRRDKYFSRTSLNGIVTMAPPTRLDNLPINIMSFWELYNHVFRGTP